MTMKVCWLVPILFFFASILNAQEAPLTAFSSCHSSLESEEILSLNADLLCLQSGDVEQIALEDVYPYIFSDQNLIIASKVPIQTLDYLLPPGETDVVLRLTCEKGHLYIPLTGNAKETSFCNFVYEQIFEDVMEDNRPVFVSNQADTLVPLQEIRFFYDSRLEAFLACAVRGKCSCSEEGQRADLEFGKTWQTKDGTTCTGGVSGTVKRDKDGSTSCEASAEFSITPKN